MDNTNTSAIPETVPTNQAISNPAQLIGAWTALFFPVLVALTAELLLRNFSNFPPQSLTSWASAARVAIVVISIYALHYFAVQCFRFYKPGFKNLLCLTLIVVGTLVTVWLSGLIGYSLSRYLASSGKMYDVPPEAFFFAIPYSAGGLLLQSIFGLQYGLVFGVTLALIMAIYLPSQPVFALLALASTLVVCLSLSRFRSRSAFIKAGINVSLLALPFALAVILSQKQLLSFASVITIVAALLGGIFAAFLASGVAPIIEHVGGYVTDMRLLEMATLDHPLLKELSILAPGTWNHSMVMGMMAESAADAIGANPVLVRVGAYFHDIGKIRKPLYFVENQAGQENRHDRLSTSMSALVIRTHVKDGLELARKYGLPQVIENMIPQHHGTSRIEYFYDKARKESEDAGLDPLTVDESLFRYPGPKPQTREAGILMLADGIEAAARTLGDPTVDRIQGMVQKMINKVFSSGELDECDLTLRDLHNIAKAFTRVLSGIYHQRIAYAEPAEKVRSSEEGKDLFAGKQEKSLADTGELEDTAHGAEDKSAKEPPKEDLKRLGI